MLIALAQISYCVTSHVHVCQYRIDFVVSVYIDKNSRKESRRGYEEGGSTNAKQEPVKLLKKGKSGWPGEESSTEHGEDKVNINLSFRRFDDRLFSL